MTKNHFRIKTPNLNNARTRKRIHNALGWAISRLDPIKPVSIPRNELYRELSQESTTTGGWLRFHLLKTDDVFIMGRTCKYYTLNPEGVDLIRELMEIQRPYNAYTGLTMREQHQTLDNALAVQWCLDKHPFDKITYEEKSYRYFTPLTSMRKSVRNAYLRENGLKVQYDLVCAAQTLLHEKYKQTTGKSLEIIESYINNRDGIRNRLSVELQLPLKTVKQIITAIFSGAYIVSNNRNSIFPLCEYDPARIEWLKQDAYMCLLREEMAQMWKAIKPLVYCSGKKITSRDKNMYYFSLEKEVMDVVFNHLDTNKHKYFILHDAVVVESNQIINITDMHKRIYKHTGLSVQLEASCL